MRGIRMAMIDTMSDATRVALGALDPDPEPVSLDAVVRDMTTGDDGVLVAQMTFTNDARDIEATLLVLFRANAHGASGDVGGVERWRRSW